MTQSMKRAVLLALLALLPGPLHAQGLSLPAPAALPATLPPALPAEALPLAELESREARPSFESFGPLADPVFVSKRFTGKERDFESGLDYFGARYISGAQGRFTSADPLFDWDEHIIDPQQWNRYAYVRNNPLRHVDPNGESIVDVFGGFVTAFGSNLALGANRPEAYNSDFALGQALGDIASVAAGGAEFSLSAALATGGALGTATGIAAPVAAPVAAAGVATAVHGVGVSASGLINLSSAVRNPFGSKGKPDHQAKVQELGDKAKAEAKPGEQVLQERQIQGLESSRRRPDQQIVGEDGKTRKVFEAERHPESKRHQAREQEYKCLGVQCETHGLDK